ncbi:MAG: autotransporter-associated beta strand repeat-containing protein, partial [Planctomycetia bacterium]|nr:autotransporter-associated beta strand repeat-containing protein [Planctomycetia bacterium]
MFVQNKSSRVRLDGLLAPCMVALVLMVFGGVKSADAAIRKWLGTTDALWATSTNWDASPFPGSGDTATFDSSTANTTINLGGGVTIGSILFDTSNAAAYTIGSGGINSQTLTLNDSGTVTMNATVVNNELFNASILLGTATAGSYTFTNNSLTNSLTFAGGVQGGTGGAAAAKTLTVAGAGTTVISGVIANGGASSLALIKSGTGTLTLSGVNTHTGATTVNTGGTLSLTGVLGATAITVNSGGTLTESVAGSIGVNNAATLTVAGTATLSGSNTYSGLTTVSSGGVLNIRNGIALGTIAGATTVVSGGALEIQGNIMTLSEALTLNGTGIGGNGALRNISGVNVYNGALTLAGNTRINSDAGRLILNGTTTTAGFTLTVGGLGYSAMIPTISGVGGLTKEDTGTLAIFGANAYTGTSTINSGIVLLGSAESANTTGPLGKQLANAAGTIVFGGGTLQYSPQNTNDYSGRFSTAASQAIKIDTNSRNVTFATNLVSSGGSLTKSGFGTLTLTGAGNTYDGGTTVNGGILLASAAGNLPSAGTLAIAAGGTFSMVNSAAVTTYVTNSLSLANGANLAFDWAGASADMLTSTAAATTSGVIGVSVNPITVPSGAPTLLASASGGLTSGGASYFLANNTNYTAALSASDTALTIGSVATGLTALTNNAFWYGNTLAGSNTAGVDNAMALSNGTVSNWSTTSGSYTATALVPGSSANAVFSATGATQQSNIVLGADMTLNSVTFNDTTPVTVGSGNALTLVSTVTGATSAISTNQDATINAGVILGSNQTWTTAAAKTLTLGGTIGNVTAGAGLTLAGAGSVVINGTAAYSGATTVNNGATLTFAAGSNKTYLGAGNTLPVNGVLNVAGNVDVENQVNNGVVNVSSTGSLTIRNAAGNGDVAAGIGAGGYGMLNIAGGAVHILGGSGGGTGSMNLINGGSQALLRISSGVLNVGQIMVARNGGGSSEITVTGGTLNRSVTGGAVFNIGDRGSFTSVVNVAGGLIDNTNGLITIGRSGGTAGSAFQVVNFDAGTIITKEFSGAQANIQTIINFNGGTIKASPGISTTAFTPAANATGSITSYVNGAFGSFAGGVVFDTNGNSPALNSALLAPTGNGVTSLSLSTGGSGYTGAPIVTISDSGTTQSGTTALSSTITMANTSGVFAGQSITGTGIPLGSIVTGVTSNTSITISQPATIAGSPTLTFKGQGATAYATIFSGAVDGFVVTNPGVGYVGTVTAALGGGFGTGGSGTAATIGTITPVANTSGGLTKNGAGTLTLSGANTFTGATSVNAGTLAFGATILNTYASDISGPGAVSHTGTGTTVLTGTNTYAGVTTLTLGVLELGSANALPGGIGSTGGTSALTFNGGVLGLGFGNFTRPLGAAGDATAANFTLAGGWAAYGTDRLVNLGGALSPITWATANAGFNAQTLILGASTATHTVDLQNPIDLGTVARTAQANDGAAAIDGKISGLLSGGAGGDITKTGTGTLELSANNTYSGATTVNAGKLVLSGDNSGSSSPMTISASAFAQFNVLNSIPSSGRTVTDTGTVMFGSAFTAGNIPAGLLRITTGSAGAVAADNYTSTNFDFNTAGLTAASLGAVSNLTYTGTYTPNTTGGYRLGGSGGTLTMGNSNALTGAFALDVKGNVILAALNNNSGATTINAGSILTLGAGVTGQNGSVGSSSIVNNGTSLVFNNADAQAYAGVISGTGALTKNGIGELTLTVPQTYTGTTTLNAGTLVLAGGNHTLAVNKALTVNGGTLNIGSNSQYVGGFSGTGGIVTGTGGTFTYTPTGAANFTGSIQGSVNFIRAGSGTGGNTNTLTLTNDSTTTGGVSVYGGDIPQAQPGVFGGMILKDSGKFSGATSLSLNNGTLFIDNSGTANDNTRVNDAATVSLNGGRIAYTGRASTASTESFGDVTVSTGMGSIITTAGTSGSAVLTLNSLTRITGATLQLDGTNLGTAGNNGRIIVTGAMTGNLAAVNGVIPGVFRGIAGASNMPVGYVAGLGFAPVGSAGGFPTTFTGALNAAAATDNVVNPSTYVVKAAGQTINTLVASNAITFLSNSDTLKIDAGMLLFPSGGQYPIGVEPAGFRGQLTSGLSTGELFIIKTNEGSGGTPGANKINAVITDNGVTSVKLILDSWNRTNLSNQIFNLTAPNTYTGGTVISGANEVLLTATTGGNTPIPAATDPTQGLIINNSVVTMQTNAQQIAATNIVTLNGGATLTLVGANNTLAGIVFNSIGGKATPTITGGTKMTITGNISSTPSDPSTTPTISVVLDLNGSSVHDITVSALPEGNFVNTNTPLNGLTISSVITNGGFDKFGTGVLNLTGANTFSGDLTIAEGVLNVAAFNEVSAAGPLGKSTNPMLLGGSGGRIGTIEYTGGSVTSTRLFTMADGGTGAFQIDAAGTSLTLSGLITGSGGLTKTGLGTLISSGTLSYTGKTLVSSGTLNVSGITSLATSAFDTSGAGTLVYANTTGSSQRFGGLSGGTNLSLASVSVAELLLNPAAGTNWTYSGNITGGSSGGVALVKTGAGRQVLAGSNSFSSGVAINAGILSLGSANAIGTTGAISFGGGTLQFSSSNSSDSSSRFSTAISQAYSFDTNGQSVTLATALTSSGGSLSKLGAGTLTLSGDNTFNAGTTISGGTLVVGSVTALGNSSAAPLTVNGGTLDLSGQSVSVGGLSGSGGAINSASVATLTAAISTDATFAGAFSGVVGFTKTGGSALTLSGSSTHSGPTTVSNGTLKSGVASVAGVSGAFGNNSAVTTANLATAAINLQGFNTQIGSLA